MWCVFSLSVCSFDELACLGESCSLYELTLDGNPVALETWYKQAALRCVLQLRQLDMKRVTVRHTLGVCLYSCIWLSLHGCGCVFVCIFSSHARHNNTLACKYCMLALAVNTARIL